MLRLISTSISMYIQCIYSIYTILYQWVLYVVHAYSFRKGSVERIYIVQYCIHNSVQLHTLAYKALDMRVCIDPFSYISLHLFQFIHFNWTAHTHTIVEKKDWPMTMLDV